MMKCEKNITEKMFVDKRVWIDLIFDSNIKMLKIEYYNINIYYM